MASPALQILSLTPPTPHSRTLLATFLPTPASNPTADSSNMLNPSTSLSFEFRNGGQEVFLDRITHRELAVQDDGSIVATVPNVPVFKRDEEGNERATEVRMYAWKGEKLLGEWDVGSF
jgi:hypothetical protein